MENRIGFGRRLGAYLLDFILIAALSIVIAVIGFASVFSEVFADMEAGKTAGDMKTAFGTAGTGVMGYMVIIYIFSFLIFLLEGLTGYTPGKFLLEIKIGDKTHTNATVGKLMSRFVIKNCSSIIALIVLFIAMTQSSMEIYMTWSKAGGLLGLIVFIGYFFALGNNKQALHDMIAGTAVYWSNSLPAAKEHTETILDQ